MTDFKEYTDPIKRLLKLYVEEARLTLTEKLTRLLTGIAIVILVAIFLIIALTFVSLGVIYQIAGDIAPIWAYMILAAFYMVLVILLKIFKRQLLLNPIARFLSGILLDNPDEPKKD